MGGMGGLRGLGVRAARAENEKAGTGGTSRCLYFGNGSLILRLTFAYPSLFLYRSYIVCIG